MLQNWFCLRFSFNLRFNFTASFTIWTKIMALRSERTQKMIFLLRLWRIFTKYYCFFFSIWQYQLLEEGLFSFQSYHMSFIRWSSSSFHRTTTHRPWKTRTCKRLLYSTTAEWTPSTDEGHSTWLKAPGSKVKTKTLNPQKVWHLFDNPLWKLLLLASVRVKLLFNVTWRVNDEVKWQVSGFKIKQIAVFTLTF